MAKPILVVGATGKQGSAFINAVLDSDEENFTLLALTRNPASPAGQKLIKRDVKIVEGDLNDPHAVFHKAREIAGGKIWGVFAVLVPQGRDTNTEEVLGKALVDAAISNDVRYFVYSSVDRGGEKRSWENPTDIPHFITKHNVELHLRQKAEETGTLWTILRPTAFMDNWNPGFFAKIFTTIWRTKLGPKKLQLIATYDIGCIALTCFQSPDVYNERALSLAGSDVSFAEAQEIFKERTSHSAMPESFEFMAKGVMWAVKDIEVMFDWFAKEGYGANIEEIKQIYPDLLDWGNWLTEQSEWVKRD